MTEEQQLQKFSIHNPALAAGAAGKNTILLTLIEISKKFTPRNTVCSVELKVSQPAFLTFQDEKLAGRSRRVMCVA